MWRTGNSRKRGPPLDEEIEDLTLSGIRWSWLSPVMLGIGAAGEVLGVVSECLTDLSVAVARHSIWKAEQKDFEESVIREIERLPNA